MKGLRLYLPPFAPDTSGAAAVFYPLGGMVIIVDAGGCAGNICGFDEPRWQQEGSKSAVFSAGLRDMDAIMGRDDKLIEKVRAACQEISPRFIAFIGTPVPAVIGTDYRALTRMAKKATGLPAIAVDSDGTRLYDTGGGKALLSLCKAFAKPASFCCAAKDGLSASPETNQETEQKPAQRKIGLLGLTPLDFSAAAHERLTAALRQDGWDAICRYDCLDDFCEAGRCEKNLVVAPLGLSAAQWLQQHLGIPYTAALPETAIAGDFLKQLQEIPASDRVLLIHQQVLALTLRRLLRQQGHEGTITCGTFFQQEAALNEPGDLTFAEEDDFQQFVATNHFDCIIGDPSLQRALPGFAGHFIALPHFAVSGTWDMP